MDYIFKLESKIAVQSLSHIFHRVTFWFYRHSWVVPVAILIGIGIVGCLNIRMQNKLTLIGTLLAFSYFLQKQKLADTQLMKELITEFNGRYDALNEKLKAILKRGKEHPSSKLTDCECEKIDDYFNLCAEEFLFYDLGYIDSRVWKAWSNGMEPYFQDQRICERWRQEKTSGSYYGFRPPACDQEIEEDFIVDILE